jgi:hypothetical protein
MQAPAGKVSREQGEPGGDVGAGRECGGPSGAGGQGVDGHQQMRGVGALVTAQPRQLRRLRPD